MQIRRIRTDTQIRGHTAQNESKYFTHLAKNILPINAIAIYEFVCGGGGGARTCVIGTFSCLCVYVYVRLLNKSANGSH